MPAIRRDGIAMTDEYTDLRTASIGAHETDDCVVKMIALVLRTSYDQAHALCERYGRKDRAGMYNSDWKRLLNDHGIRLQLVPSPQIIAKYPKAHQVLKNITTHHPDRFHKVWDDGHRYILHLGHHVAYVEHGRCHDWSRGRALRVRAVYRIVEETK